jgi:hypothetical protein
MIDESLPVFRRFIDAGKKCGGDFSWVNFDVCRAKASLNWKKRRQQ